MSAAASAARTLACWSPQDASPTDLGIPVRADRPRSRPAARCCRPVLSLGGGQLCLDPPTLFPTAAYGGPSSRSTLCHSSGRLDPTVACRFGADGIGRDRAFMRSRPPRRPRSLRRPRSAAHASRPRRLFRSHADLSSATWHRERDEPLPSCSPLPRPPSSRGRMLRAKTTATPMAAARHGDRERDERRWAAPLRGRRRHVGGCCARRRRPRRLHACGDGRAHRRVKTVLAPPAHR